MSCTPVALWGRSSLIDKRQCHQAIRSSPDSLLACPSHVYASQVSLSSLTSNRIHQHPSAGGEVILNSRLSLLQNNDVIQIITPWITSCQCLSQCSYSMTAQSAGLGALFRKWISLTTHKLQMICDTGCFYSRQTDR